MSFVVPLFLELMRQRDGFYIRDTCTNYKEPFVHALRRVKLSLSDASLYTLLSPLMKPVTGSVVH